MYACYAVSPSGWFGPEGQLYSEFVAALGVDNDSGMFMAGYAGLCIFAVFPPLVGMPALPGIMLGFVAVAVLVVDIGSCMLVLVLQVVMQVLWLVLLVLRCVSFVVVRPKMLGIMVGMTRRTLQRHNNRSSVVMDIGTCMAGFAGFLCVLCCVFPLFVGRGACGGHGSGRARPRHRQLHVHESGPHEPPESMS